MIRVFQIKDGNVKSSRYFIDTINDKHQRKSQVVWFAM
jgi:hypothetical protein